jgi:hypothetical protein
MIKVIKTNKEFNVIRVEGYILEMYGRNELRKFRNNEFIPNKKDKKLIDLLNQNKNE